MLQGLLTPCKASLRRVPAPSSGRACPHLSVLMEVEFQGLPVLFKAQDAHGPYQVIPVDGLPFFSLALVTGPAQHMSTMLIAGNPGPDATGPC